MSTTEGPRDQAAPDHADLADTVPWRVFVREAERRLVDAGFETAAHDARRIVEQAAGVDGAELVLALDDPATTRGVARFDAMLARRLAGEPVQYVVGSWGFRTLDLMVDRRVLIPRPETEVVAGLALDELDRRRGVGEPDRQLVAVDLGTGSGAIGLSLASERRGVTVWLTDESADALDVARANLAGIGTAGAHVRVVQGSWFAALPDELQGAIDVIVSNPPYIGASEALPPSVHDWEPASALVAGPRGDEALEVILDAARRWLAPGGAVVVELAPDQAAPIASTASALGYVDVEIGQDLTGRDRTIVARWPR